LNKKLTILSTRELDASLVDSIVSEDIIFDQLPFIEMIPRDDSALISTVNALAAQHVMAIFTSRIAVNAVTAMLASTPPSWKIACMGGATRKLAADFFGGEAVVITSASAKELGEKLAATPEQQQIVFFAGNRRLEELPSQLKDSGRNHTEVIVYDTIETPVQVDDLYDAILFFSPSAAQSFFSLNKIPSQTVCFSIGETTAATVRRLTGNDVIVSPVHSPERMIETVRDYFRNKN
jgi:uroporphyrinogen-III synthase